jgi:RHS repeat-associated protein
MTNAAAHVVWSADYLPFGQSDVTVSEVENNLRFAGQYYDQETGLHYNYHRYYDPTLGRYLRADPIGIGGGINPYLFEENIHINNGDPSGLISCPGNWRRKDWEYMVLVIFRKCICYWYCESCDGSYLWDGNIYNPPSTTGDVIHQGAGGLKRGDNCMCKPPGLQKGCDECPPPLYSTDFPFSDVG